MQNSKTTKQAIKVHGAPVPTAACGALHCGYQLLCVCPQAEEEPQHADEDTEEEDDEDSEDEV